MIEHDHHSCFPPIVPVSPLHVNVGGIAWEPGCCCDWCNLNPAWTDPSVSIVSARRPVPCSTLFSAAVIHSILSSDATNTRLAGSILHWSASPALHYLIFHCTLLSAVGNLETEFQKQNMKLLLISDPTDGKLKQGF